MPAPQNPDQAEQPPASPDSASSGHRHQDLPNHEHQTPPTHVQTAWPPTRIDAFVELQRKIVRHLDAIHAALEHGLSNALIESTNTKIRLIMRMAYGFRNVTDLIALALLGLGGHRPALPGRAA
jgi:hypothetical protein